MLLFWQTPQLPVPPSSAWLVSNPHGHLTMTAARGRPQRRISAGRTVLAVNAEGDEQQPILRAPFEYERKGQLWLCVGAAFRCVSL